MDQLQANNRGCPLSGPSVEENLTRPYWELTCAKKTLRSKRGRNGDNRIKKIKSVTDYNRVITPAKARRTSQPFPHRPLALNCLSLSHHHHHHHQKAAPHLRDQGAPRGLTRPPSKKKKKMSSQPSNPSSTSKPHSNGQSDTSFRKTWDRNTYSALASERESAEKATSKARYEAKLLGRKYHPPPSSSTPQTETLSRSSRLDVSTLIGKTTLLPAGAGATGKRGRGAGFYCEECDLTFKDNLQFVDHLNSRQHLMATGQSGTVKRATVEEVRERLAWLVERKREREENVEEVDLGKRLEARRVEEERIKEEKIGRASV